MTTSFAHIFRGATLITLFAAPAFAQPGLTLPGGGVSATLTVEGDVSAATAGDTTSFAPDVWVGATEDLSLGVVHSTFGRSGFRGAAGAGICAGDACANTYDNAGLEALYSLLRGPLSIAANPGIHATSFDRGFYVAKLGGKARYKLDRLTLMTLPSVTIAMSHRDDTMPNRDRLWLPVSGTYMIAGGFSAGLTTGFKAPLDDIGDSYEIAAGVVAQYAYSPQLSFGASWVHGKLFGGDAVLPDDMSGIDSRAVQLWLSATR
jgi:hypothetical protein